MKDAVDKLAESGLTVENAELLGMEILEAAQMKKYHESLKGLPGILIKYFGIDKQPLSTWPQHEPFFRVRYLPGSLAVTEKVPRYAQPPSSGCAAYFPRNVDWRTICDTPDIPVLITEGEFKAAKACVAGYPTIGLGGVYNFKSAKRGVMFLPELEKFQWIKRTVFVVFDSDYKRNHHVCQALNELSEELKARGAFPHVVSLPDVYDDGKTGLDDFLVKEGTKSLKELLSEAVPLTMAQPLWKMNEKLIYVRDPGLVYELRGERRISPNSFVQHAYSTESYPERVVRKDGSVSIKKVSASQEWLKWPLRREVAALTYKPGQPAEYGDEYNVWPGWGVTPIEGDMEPFTSLVDYLFTGCDNAEKEWFLNWCAYPIQYPGVKMFTSAVLHGTRHGTGKSLIGYTLGKIYGKNFSEITQSDLHSNFNEWAESKQFVLGDDVTGSNRRADADLLKKLITQKSLRVNPKYIASYVVPDCVNYLFTSNHPDAFFLEDDDRRFFVHEILVGPLGEEFYAEYDLWLSGRGASHLFHWLKQRDVSGFNPYAPAYKTKARTRMIMDNKSDIGSWVAQLLLDPEPLLKEAKFPLGRELFTNRELLMMYDPMQTTRVTANGLGREMRRAGCVQAAGGIPIRFHGTQARYYSIANHEKWATASMADVTSHLRSFEK